MMGVHGNGLTSLIWMKPTPRSTVMEFFYPDGFAHDYEWTTRALGMVHYGFWGEKYVTLPMLPDIPLITRHTGFSQVQTYLKSIIRMDSKEIPFRLTARQSLDCVTIDWL